MAVETATERAIFFDVDDFGVAATYTASGGSPATVNGIFDNEFFEVEAGGTVAVAMERRGLHAAHQMYQARQKAMRLQLIALITLLELYKSMALALLSSCWRKINGACKKINKR